MVQKMELACRARIPAETFRVYFALMLFKKARIYRRVDLDSWPCVASILGKGQF